MGLKVSGMDETLRKLRKFDAQADAEIGEALSEAGAIVQGTAVRMIQRGGRSGAIYPAGVSGQPVTGSSGKVYAPKRKGGRVAPHQASAPGEAPKTDFGILAGSISAVKVGDDVHVGTDVKYGRYLEFGTSNMAPRPWLIPSKEQSQRAVSQQFRKALSGVISRMVRK